jgi:hypothetical protein
MLHVIQTDVIYVGSTIDSYLVLSMKIVNSVLGLAVVQPFDGNSMRYHDYVCLDQTFSTLKSNRIIHRNISVQIN